MKFTTAYLYLLPSVALLNVGVSAIDFSTIPVKAMENLAQTPGCAMQCILDPHWAQTYAPECSDLPVGKEYGARLCRNYMYQHMVDNCIKGKCNDNERRLVTPNKSPTYNVGEGIR
jgi:hypothetical protein